jgi:hypothetical protein
VIADVGADYLAHAMTRLRFANSYSRMPALLELAWLLDAPDWLALLGEHWSDCDNIGEHIDELFETPFADLMENPAQLRHHMMNDEELRALEALPECVPLFRGCYARNKWGLSWSLHRHVAEKFPTLHRYRQDGQALFVKATVKRSSILALKLCRNEAEVIAWRPKHVSTSHLRLVATGQS